MCEALGGVPPPVPQGTEGPEAWDPCDPKPRQVPAVLVEHLYARPCAKRSAGATFLRDHSNPEGDQDPHVTEKGLREGKELAQVCSMGNRAHSDPVMNHTEALPAAPHQEGCGNCGLNKQVSRCTAASDPA